MYDYSGATDLDVYFPGGENEVWISSTSDDVRAGTGQINVPVARENVNSTLVCCIFYVFILVADILQKRCCNCTKGYSETKYG